MTQQQDLNCLCLPALTQSENIPESGFQPCRELAQTQYSSDVLIHSAHLVIFAETMAHWNQDPQIPSATQGVKVQLGGQRVTSTLSISI